MCIRDRLFTAGRTSADGFHAGDAWRGTMTNCQQSQVRGPPPAIRTSVRSLYAALPEHHRLQVGAAAKAEDARAHSVAVLGVCGLMLWALVYTLSTKVRLSPRGANAVQKFFPSPRQSWLPHRGSFSLA